MPWATEMSIARPPFRRVHLVAEADTVSSRGLSRGSIASSSLPVRTHSFISQSHPTLFQADNYKGKKFESISYPALSELTLSLGTPYLVRSVRFPSVSEAEILEFFMRETCSGCSVLSHRAPEMVLVLAKISLGWL